MSRADRLRACLLGGALGDAVGSRHEGAASVGVPLAPHQITDDTQLTLATCDALIRARGTVDPAAIADAMLQRHRTGAIIGVGAATLGALRALAVGGHWALVGRRGEHAAGNGAAIRVAPLAFFLDPRSSRGRGAIRDVSRITHHSDEAYSGALAVAITIHDAVHDRIADVQTWWPTLLCALPDTSLRDVLDSIGALPPILSIDDLADRTGTGGHVLESVPLALAAALRTEHGFRELIETLVRVGGDTDSIASIAGQVRGARDGATALPEEWLAMLRVRSEIEETIARLERLLPRP